MPEIPKTVVNVGEAFEGAAVDRWAALIAEAARSWKVLSRAGLTLDRRLVSSASPAGRWTRADSSCVTAGNQKRLLFTALGISRRRWGSAMRPEAACVCGGRRTTMLGIAVSVSRMVRTRNAG